MKAAKELAATFYSRGSHAHESLTAAIEARDAEHEARYNTVRDANELLCNDHGKLMEARAEVKRLREALEVMAPVKCYACMGIPDERAGCHHALARRTVASTATPVPALPVSVLDPRDADIARLKSLIDRDRTGLAAALVEVKKRAAGGRWISEGRGSYRYDEDDYRKETAWLVADVMKIAEDALRASGNLANEAFHPPAASPTSEWGSAAGPPRDALPPFVCCDECKTETACVYARDCDKRSPGDEGGRR